jgi:energy-coupling factor transporter ATP-binding protein EcfA2
MNAVRPITAEDFRPAQREQVPLLIGLVGPSGSGKTYSALRLAKGIQSVAGGKIAVIDTEARRALHYAKRFPFDHLEFTPPFGSVRYMDALAAAVKHGARTIIVDSMSHEHEGAGGYLETHEAELNRIAGDDWKKRERVKFTAWIKPAGDRRKLINAILQMKANFIFCFRAKEKLALVKDQDGKTVPVPLGWQAIAGEEFVFEMTARCLLPPGSAGVPDWSDESMKHGAPKLSEEHKAILTPGRQLDEEVGRLMAEWAKGDVPAREGADLGAADGELGDLVAIGESAATLGTEQLRTWFNGLPRAAKAAIKPHMDRLKTKATESDATPDAAFDDAPAETGAAA